MAGEYAVASEVCRRDLYSQITLGNLKRTDILVYNPVTGKQAKIEVKSKQARWWPSVRGINGPRELLVFVDFQGVKDEARPVFYVMNKWDWQRYLKRFVLKASWFHHLDQGFIPVDKHGNFGVGVESKEISRYREKWKKLKKIV